MKIIDLLNKMANGENIPQKIKVDGTVYKLDRLEYFYQNGNGDDLLQLAMEYSTPILLNMQVELIEDEIDIDNIEELNDTCYDEENMISEEKEYYHNLTREQQNTILRAVKQLNKEIKNIKEKTSD